MLNARTMHVWSSGGELSSGRGEPLGVAIGDWVNLMSAIESGDTDATDVTDATFLYIAANASISLGAFRIWRD